MSFTGVVRGGVLGGLCIPAVLRWEQI